MALTLTRDALTEREQTVLRLRFGLDNGERHTLAEIGKELNVSRERARQLEQQALSKLRRQSRQQGDATSGHDFVVALGANTPEVAQKLSAAIWGDAIWGEQS